MKRFSRKTISVVAFIILFSFFLIACSSPPLRNLASDASLVHKGFSTAKEIRELLGPPDKIINKANGLQDWYYYNLQTSSIRKIPFLGKKLAKEKLEILRITFSKDLVIDCQYYVRSKDEYQSK